MNRERSRAMRRSLLALTAIATALALSPATSGAGEMKDSWVTTKAKMAMVKDDRVKARRVKVETQDGIVTLRGKGPPATERLPPKGSAGRTAAATPSGMASRAWPAVRRPPAAAKT